MKGEGEAALVHHEAVVASPRSSVRERRSALHNMGQLFRTRHMHTQASGAQIYIYIYIYMSL
jgi:hypothetical protein